MRCLLEQLTCFNVFVSIFYLHLRNAHTLNIKKSVCVLCRRFFLKNMTNDKRDFLHSKLDTKKIELLFPNYFNLISYVALKNGLKNMRMELVLAAHTYSGRDFPQFLNLKNYVF